MSSIEEMVKNFLAAYVRRRTDNPVLRVLSENADRLAAAVCEQAFDAKSLRSAAKAADLECGTALRYRAIAETGQEWRESLLRNPSLTVRIYTILKKLNSLIGMVDKISDETARSFVIMRRDSFAVLFARDMQESLANNDRSFTERASWTTDLSKFVHDVKAFIDGEAELPGLATFRKSAREAA